MGIDKKDKLAILWEELEKNKSIYSKIEDERIVKSAEILPLMNQNYLFNKEDDIILEERMKKIALWGKLFEEADYWERYDRLKILCQNVIIDQMEKEGIEGIENIPLDIEKFYKYITPFVAKDLINIIKKIPMNSKKKWFWLRGRLEKSVDSIVEKSQKKYNLVPKWEIDKLKQKKFIEGVWESFNITLEKDFLPYFLWELEKINFSQKEEVITFDYFKSIHKTIQESQRWYEKAFDKAVKEKIEYEHNKKFKKKKDLENEQEEKEEKQKEKRQIQEQILSSEQRQYDEKLQGELNQIFSSLALNQKKKEALIKFILRIHRNNKELRIVDLYEDLWAKNISEEFLEALEDLGISIKYREEDEIENLENGGPSEFEKIINFDIDKEVEKREKEEILANKDREEALSSETLEGFIEKVIETLSQPPFNYTIDNSKSFKKQLIDFCWDKNNINNIINGFTKFARPIAKNNGAYSLKIPWKNSSRILLYKKNNSYYIDGLYSNHDDYEKRLDQIKKIK